MFFKIALGIYKIVKNLHSDFFKPSLIKSPNMKKHFISLLRLINHITNIGKLTDIFEKI